MVLKIKAGHDVGYLTGPVASGRESYYSGAVDAGEPPGTWWGAGAADLGLVGEVNADLLEAIFTHHLDPRDERSHDRSTWGEADEIRGRQKGYRSPAQIYAAALAKAPHAGPERREEMWTAAQSSSRQGVAFHDAMFSATKSVSVFGAACEWSANDAAAQGDHEKAAVWSMRHQAVEAAVLAGAEAALQHLQEHAGYARAGHHGGGEGRWVDANRWVVARFLQHDSRDRDPQLHVHQAVWNKQQCTDGQWRGLDGLALTREKHAAAAIGERVMEAELSRALGVRWVTRADGQGRELAGVDQGMIDLFSSRRLAITAQAQEMLAKFEERVGREASTLERSRIAQEATLITRQGKSHDGETAEERSDRWAQQCRAQVDGGLAAVAGQVLAQSGDGPDLWSRSHVVEAAIGRLEEQHNSWTHSDVVRAVGESLPGNLGIAAADMPRLLHGLADEVHARTVQISPNPDPDPSLPAELRRLDGSSQYSAPGAVRHSSPRQLAGGAALRAAAVLRTDPLTSVEQADRMVQLLAESGRELGVDQAAAVRGVLTSGAQTQTLLAAAGTGKSYVVSAINDAVALSGSEGRVIGLAPSQIAANVLAEDIGLTANTTAWLLGTRPELAPQRGDLVVIDEAGMTTNPQILEVQQRCHDVGASVLLVGDPKQLTSTGPGGALVDISERGISYSLSEVRRFTEAWEREASLQLRDGDAAALDAYEKHGRLVDAGTAEQAQAAAGRAWLADTLQDRESLLLVGSNAEAAQLSAAMRAELVQLGRVEEQGVALDRQGTVAGVGDLIQARHNGWNLVGVDGNQQAPLNRTTYRVVGLRPDGGLEVATVVGRDETGAEMFGTRLQLPRDYTARHVDLAYASTEHAAQGRTVDTGHSLTGGYVSLTRGRDCNTFWATTVPTSAEELPGTAQTVEERTARAVLTDRMASRQDDLTALAEREQLAIEARGTQRHVGQLVDGVAHVTAGRTAAILDRLAAEGALDVGVRSQLAADQAAGSLDRLLRTAELAGHSPEQVLRDAIAERDFNGVRAPAQVVHSRITTALHGQLSPVIGSVHDLIPADAPEQWREWLHHRAEDADARRGELGSQIAAEAPAWAVEALGQVPDDLMDRLEWESRAGWAAQYREMAGYTHDTDPLGAAPPAGLVESAAIFRAGHDALDLPDATAEEADLSDGRLRARVDAYEREEQWAPRYVADELSAAHQTAAAKLTDATMWEAHAQAVADEQEREQLQQAALGARIEAAEAREAAAALEEADRVRGEWFAETSATREAGERARVELSARGVDLAHPDDLVTAEEWLAEHDRAQAEQEAARDQLAETEVVDLPAAVAAAEAAAYTEQTLAEDTLGEQETETVDLEETYEDLADESADEVDQGSGVPDTSIEDLLEWNVVEPDERPDAVEELFDALQADTVDEHAEIEDLLDNMPGDPLAPPPETAVPDIRDTSAQDGREHEVAVPRTDRVPRTNEVEETTRRAAEAAAEVANRQADQARRDEEERGRRAYYEAQARTDDTAEQHNTAELEQTGDAAEV